MNDTIIGVGVFAAIILAMVVHNYLDARADAAVQLSPRDFEYSEFRPGKLKYTIKFIIAAALILGAALNKELELRIFLLLCGVPLLLWTAIGLGDRIVVQEGSLIRYSGKRERWRARWEELHHLTIVGFNGIQMASMQKVDKTSLRIPMHLYNSNRKLRVMLDNPVESWARAHGEL